ncbi:MAG: CAP domain-containing protein [Chloroflexota bacterium]
MSTETVTKKWGAVVTLEVSRWAITWRMRLMNASRSAGGLVPLTLDPVVSAAARAHSAVEAQYRYVYHDGPDGTAKSRYVPVCGTGWYGENTGKVWNDNVDVLHVEFMNEPWEPINHRTNIMDPLFRRVGIGAVVGPDALYMTMAFCR